MRELKKRRMKSHGDVEFYNPNICFCSSDPPPPDPLIGQAAMSNADLAKEMAGVAKDQLAWEKDRAARQDPLVEKIVNQQIQSGQDNADRATEQWNIYKSMFQPVESKMVDDAMNFDSPDRQNMLAGQAAADVTQGYTGALDQNQRAMERMGVNPNSGKFAAINNETNLAQAKDTAGAMNSARNNAITQGMALRQGAAQFGRNMPNTGLAADSLALNAGSSAVGNLNAGNAAHAAGLNSAAQWFSGAQAGNNSAGQLGLGQYQGQLNAWQGQQNATANMLSGIGSLVGTLGGASILKGGAGGAGAAAMLGLRKGAVIKNNRAYGLSSLPYASRPATKSKYSGSLGALKRNGYAEGGMIEGPGTGTSDSIPGTIEGVQPIRVSNGEAVLNKEAVDLVGEEFIHRINAGGLMMLKNRSEELAENA